MLTSYFLLHDSVSRAHAQAVSLGISPTILQIEATPPASIKHQLTIENNGEEPISLKIALKAFTASEKENGFVKYFPENDPRSYPRIFQYIQIMEGNYVKDTIRLAPKQKKTVTMHIGVPKEEPLGDHYFSIIFVSENAQTPDQSASQTPTGIATNVLLSLGPKGIVQGSLVEYSVPFFVEHGPVPFTVRVKNSSEHAIVPKGEIMIKNMFGQRIGRVDLLPVNILAKTNRAVPDSLMSPEASKSPNFIRPLTKYEAAVWPETFLLGPYTADLTIALSEQGPVFRKTIYFFAFPWYLAISIIVLIGIGIYLYLRVKKRLT